MPALGFWSLIKYPNKCDGIPRCRWAGSEFPKCQQKNHNSWYKFTPQFLHGEHKKKKGKTPDKVSCVKEKKNC